MTALLLTCLFLYLLAPVVFVASWFIDLWAKSYDIPPAQVLAKIILSVLLGVAAAGHTWVVGLMLVQVAHPAAAFGIALSVLPPTLVLLWTVHAVNWRTVYVGAAVGAMVSWGAAPVSSLAVSFATLVVLAIVGCWVYNELPHVRFARYEKVLRRACSCCGYQQRAVRELFAFGRTGECVVDAYLNGRESWQDSRVRDEVCMFRPTTAVS